MKILKNDEGLKIVIDIKTSIGMAKSALARESNG